MGRGNQYIQLVKVLYCKLPANGKQLPAFPLEVGPGIELPSQRWEARVLVLWPLNPVCFTNILEEVTVEGHISSIIKSCGVKEGKYQARKLELKRRAFKILPKRWYWRTGSRITMLKCRSIMAERLRPKFVAFMNFMLKRGDIKELKFGATVSTALGISILFRYV